MVSRKNLTLSNRPLRYVFGKVSLIRVRMADSNDAFYCPYEKKSL